MALLFILVPGGVRADDGAAIRVTQVVAHRGSSADRPENTLAAIRRAIEAGATAVEVDVRLTRDGVPVLLHDSTLDRTTSGRGQVHKKTLAEIERLDAGSWFHPRFTAERVPTLARALALCRNRIDVLLDLKGSGDDYHRQVVEVVKAHGDPLRTIAGVRSVEQARQIGRMLPDARRLGFVSRPGQIEAYAAAGVDTIRLWPAWIRFWPAWLTGSTLVERVRRAGMKLHINAATGAPEEVARLLAHRPDSLLSDDPARLIQSLAQLSN